MYRIRIRSPNDPIGQPTPTPGTTQAHNSLTVKPLVQKGYAMECFVIILIVSPFVYEGEPMVWRSAKIVGVLASLYIYPWQGKGEHDVPRLRARMDL